MDFLLISSTLVLVQYLIFLSDPALAIRQQYLTGAVPVHLLQHVSPLQLVTYRRLALRAKEPFEDLANETGEESVQTIGVLNPDGTATELRVVFHVNDDHQQQEGGDDHGGRSSPGRSTPTPGDDCDGSGRRGSGRKGSDGCDIFPRNCLVSELPTVLQQRFSQVSQAQHGVETDFRQPHLPASRRAGPPPE